MRQSICSKNPIVGPGTVSTKDCHFVAVPLDDSDPCVSHFVGDFFGIDGIL